MAEPAGGPGPARVPVSTYRLQLRDSFGFARAAEQGLTRRRARPTMREAVEEFMTIDWSECKLVESVAGKVGGKPVVKGTRIPADTILADEELGATVEETHESFPSLSLDTIRSIRAYGHAHKPQLQP